MSPMRTRDRGLGPIACAPAGSLCGYSGLAPALEQAFSARDGVTGKVFSLPR